MRRQIGVGLIELMVSITIGVFVLAGVLQLYLSSSQNVSTFEGSSRIQENARYAFSRLEKDIGSAGNMGCFSFSSMNQMVTSVVNGATVKSMKNRRIESALTVNAGAGQLNDFSRFVDGENGTGLPGTTTDKIYLRFISTENRFPLVGQSAGSYTLPAGAAAKFSAGDVAAVGDCSSVSFFSVSGVSGNSVNYTSGLESLGRFKGQASTAQTTTDVLSKTYIYGGAAPSVVKYEINTSATGTALGNTCSATSTQYCALFRNGVEIVEGVHDLQFEYAFLDDKDTSNKADDVLKLLDSAQMDSAVDSSSVNIADVAWGKVDRIKVTISFNSVQNASTNVGVDLLTRDYSQVFVVSNQIPLCEHCKGMASL